MGSFNIFFMEPSMSNLLAIPFSSSPLEWEITKRSRGQDMQSVPADKLLNDAMSADASPDGKRIAGTELQRRLDSGEIGQNLSAADKEEVQKLLDSMKNGELSPDGAQRLKQLLQPSPLSSGNDNDIR